MNVNLYDNPDHEALSYCWGDAANPIRIHSGKESIDITRNLHDALVKLRDAENSRTLRIDAICIAQCDLQERSRQVGIMMQIYKQSKKDLVWLGPETGDTAKAFELIPYVLKVFRETFHGKLRPIRLDRCLLEHLSILRVCPQVRLIEPFIQLEQRPYFSRIRILQELAVSYNKATLLLGQFSLSWEENTGSKDISSLTCEVYTSDIVEVYKNLARSYIQRNGNLDILGYIQRGSSIPYLLSRVPNWTSQGDILVKFRSPNPFGICFNYHVGGENGCGGTSTSVDGKTLNSNGIIFDKITRISGLIDEAWIGGCCNVRIWETIAKLRERSNYVAGGTAMELFFITELAGCPKSVYDTLKGRLQELWEEAKNHIRQKTIYGSFAASTANGLQQKKINLILVNERETGDVEALLFSSLRYTKRRRFATTDKGYYALVPAEANPGDYIAILEGRNWPFVFRAQEQSWKLVGECYVYRIMNGEALMNLLAKDWQ
ncbi:heterokaryon incompatibility protein-domain-containing protein [Tricladium varicosporioides]|nr:heterokaryon incompatibility protein-domain-containing protein [Hymenoscyphus varicosporioides]